MTQVSSSLASVINTLSLHIVKEIRRIGRRNATQTVDARGFRLPFIKNEE